MGNRWLMNTFLGALIAAPLALADSTTYMVNFTLNDGSILPKMGTFTYDPSLQSFSDFEVLWNGLTFDLTDSANNPNDATPPCVGAKTGAGASFALLDGACSGPHTGWLGAVGNGGAVFVFEAFPTPLEFIAIEGNVSTSASDTFANGQWTIAPVSEPSAFVPLIPLAPLALVAQRRRKLRCTF
jgi:hypothetical protein